MTRPALRALTVTIVLAACARASTTSALPEAPAPLSAETPMVAATSQPGATPAVGAELTEEEVRQRSAAVFGEVPPVEMEEPVADLEDEPATATVEETTWDIDVRSYETHERVAYYVAHFSGPARDRIAARLSRGSRYDAMIRGKFRAAGLPEDLSYLALIESGYNPHAYSRAAAVGMWQFMTATARGMGMRVDWWVDERRDPARATDGAIRFLGILREQFGSWYLAAAAYNGGPGRVSRGLSRYSDELEGTTGDDLFFALAEKNYLRRETREYVPQLIAAAIVGKEPSRYGIRVDSLPAFAYDSVLVGPSLPLAAVARATGTSLDEIRDLNPHVLRGVTPPRGSFWVRVPLGVPAGFEAALAALPDEERIAWTRVRSKKGETLASIARRHGLTATQLAWYNPKDGTRPTRTLPVGSTILVPSAAVVAGARDVPDPAVERYSASTRVHIVRKGETLSHIARRYGTTVTAIQRLNRMKKTVIFPGQQLVVRGRR